MLIEVLDGVHAEERRFFVLANVDLLFVYRDFSNMIGFLELDGSELKRVSEGIKIVLYEDARRLARCLTTKTSSCQLVCDAKVSNFEIFTFGDQVEFKFYRALIWVDSSEF